MNFPINISIGLLLAIFNVTFCNISGKKGGPLSLTDLMDHYKAEEYGIVRNLATVNHSAFRGIDSYAGFFRADAYIYNVFFWYFPAKVNGRNAPVVLYLEGTPGKSTLFSVFSGNGPLELEPNGDVSWRKNSLNNRHHVIYMETLINPGLSHSQRHREISSELTSAAHGYISFSAIKQFFKLFTNIQRNEFYLAGNYYAGLLIPELSAYLNNDQRKYPDHPLTINLKGIVVESGFIDPENQLTFGDYLYKSGLIDTHARAEFVKQEIEIRAIICHYQKGNAYEKLEALITGGNSLFKSLTGRTHPYHLLQDTLDPVFNDDPYIIERMTNFLARQVGYRRYSTSDPMRSERLHRVLSERYTYFGFGNLTEKYRVLLYSGNLDILCSYPSTHNWIVNYAWQGVGPFYGTRKEKLYDVNGELVGYIKKKSNLNEVVLLNVGHYPSIDKPKTTLELIEKFIGGKL